MHQLQQALARHQLCHVHCFASEILLRIFKPDEPQFNLILLSVEVKHASRSLEPHSARGEFCRTLSWWLRFCLGLSTLSSRLGFYQKVKHKNCANCCFWDNRELPCRDGCLTFFIASGWHRKNQHFSVLCLGNPRNRPRFKQRWRLRYIL